MRAYMSHYLSEVEAKTMPREVIVQDAQKEVFDGFLASQRIGKIVICVDGFNVHFHGILTETPSVILAIRGKLKIRPVFLQV